MRLITHNMMCCNIKGVTNGFPLKIEAERVEVKESEYDAEVIMAKNLAWIFANTALPRRLIDLQWWCKI